MRELTHFIALALALVWGEWTCFATVALPDSKDRSPVICEVASRGILSISGALRAPEVTELNYRAGILLVRYSAADGTEVPAKDLIFSPMFKCGYRYLAAGATGEAFSFDLTVPDGAVRAEISVSRFACKDAVLLSEFNYEFMRPGPHRWRMQIAEAEFNVQAGRLYEITVKGRVPPVDCTNQQALARCDIGFRGDDSELAVDDSLVTGFMSGGRNKGVEYLCADQAVREGDALRWRFQVRAPGGADRMVLDCKPCKCSEKVLFGDPVVRPCELSYDWVGGEEGLALRRMVRLDELNDVLRLEGQCCDTAGSPLADNGMLTVVFTPFCHSGERRAIESPIALDANGNIRHKFHFRPGCFGGRIEIRTVTTNRCRIVGMSCRGMFDAKALPSEKSPLVYLCATTGGETITISGVIDETDAKGESSKSAIVAISFTNRVGKVLKSGQLTSSEKFGEYFYLQSGPASAPFCHHVKAPQDAVGAVLKISRFYNKRALSLRNLRMTTQVPRFSNALMQGLRENVPADAILSHPRLVKQAVEEFWGAGGEELVRVREDNPVVRMSPNHGLIIGPEYSAPTGACSLVIRDYEGVDMHPSMDWSMNPFTNSTWRLKYLSGYWIPFSGAAIADERDYYNHCKTYWQSFMSRFSYPNGTETIAYNAHACAARIEAILLTTYGKKWVPETGVGFPSLRKQLAQDPQFLRQLLYQLSVDVGLVARHLRARSLDLHNYNIIMATALLQFADCFKEHEFAHSYRDLAVETIIGHLDLLFEPDGLLREQAAFYHHLFTRYFTGLYLHMRDNKSADEKTLAAFKNRLARLVEVDFLMCPPDGMSVPMGDIPSNEMTWNECKADARELGLDAEQNPIFAGAFNRLPDISVFRESGIYIFRNPKKGRFLFVDLSDSLKVHGHRDLGSWQYYSQGVRWISDLGGPCEYGTKRHREFIASSSHTLVEPVGINQSSGVAFDVELKDCGGSWELSCRSNVYGPTVEHVKKFVIAKDLSTFSVTDAFPGKTGDVRGRLTLAPGCDVTIDKNERTACLSNGDSSIKVILPRARSHVKLKANASLRSNRLSEVWLLDSLCVGQEPVTYVIQDEK